ncbi:MAG: helix-turn-helix domain-containing protein [Armatimonadetes bacterium]|nr:helix-turn-helix domain-containing protein [Armatimonadota bacterium]
MNLADAIRLASRRIHGGPIPPLNSPNESPLRPPVRGEETACTLEVTPMSMEANVSATNKQPEQSAPARERTAAPPITGTGKYSDPEEPNPAVTSGAGSVVRLELFLSPEQMHQMLRGILQGAHTVMTTREAAQHVRVKQATLVEMAERGEIPAFMVEGQWKFPRHAVDEWIALQTLTVQASDKKEDADAA